MQAAAQTVRAVSDRFLAEVYPLVLRRASRAFGHFSCPGRQADAIQDALLHAWVDYLRLVERGLVDQVPARSVAYLAVVRARIGRRPQGGNRQVDQDALSWRAQNRVGFRVRSGSDEVAPPTRHRRRAGVPERVGIRLDFLRWAKGQPDRDQMAMRALASGDRPLEVARRMGRTPTWVSLRRQRWVRSWREFAG